MNNVGVTRVKHGERAGSGKIESFFYDEEEGVFRLMVKHVIGSHLGTTPVELKPSRDAALILCAKVEGWLTEAEAETIFDYVNEATAPVVEIGSFMGKSTIIVGWAARLGHGVEVHSVDPHDVGSPEIKHLVKGSVGTWPTYYMNMQRTGLSGYVVSHRETSLSASSKFEGDSLGLVFIDGDHGLAYEDFGLWDPKLKVGGIMLFHDSSWPVVETTIKRKVKDSDRYDLIGVVDSLTIAKKLSFGR